MPYFQTQPNIRIALGPYGTSMVVLKKKREISVCTPPEMVEERKDSRTQRKKANNKKFDY